MKRLRECKLDNIGSPDLWRTINSNVFHYCCDGNTSLLRSACNMDLVLVGTTNPEPDSMLCGRCLKLAASDQERKRINAWYRNRVARRTQP